MCQNPLSDYAYFDYFLTAFEQNFIQTVTIDESIREDTAFGFQKNSGMRNVQYRIAKRMGGPWLFRIPRHVQLPTEQDEGERPALEKRHTLAEERCQARMQIDSAQQPYNVEKEEIALWTGVESNGSKHNGIV